MIAGAASDETRIAERLCHLALLAIAAVATARIAIFFAPVIVFDSDPAFVTGTIGALGPAGSVRLDVVLLLAAAAALLGETLAGRGVEPLLLALAALPLPWVILHGHDGLDDLWLGASWSAAALAAVAVAHLARAPRARRVLAALLVAGLVPVLSRGAANVTYEHDATVAQYEAQRAELLADRGWEPGSPSALIFERRMRQRQPTAWFLTTNVFGTFAAVTLVVGLGLAIGAVAARMTSGWWGVGGLLAGAGAVGLALTGSKGAIVVGAGAVAVLVLLVAPGAIGAAARRRAAWLGVLAVAAVLLAVAARGTVLSEGFAGDRSLLFRWHYAQSAAAMIAEAPVSGVGPGGFQSAYARHRVPRNPEEVASAHAAVWDWAASYGVVGLAWTALLVVLLTRAGRAVREARGDIGGDDDAPRDALIAAAIVAVAGLGPALIVEWHVLDGRGILVRALGALGFVAAAPLAARLFAAVPPTVERATLLAAALAVAVHAQIEITLVQPGPALWCWALIALAGAGPRRAESVRHGRVFGATAAAACFALAVLLAWRGAAPATSQERATVDAAAILWPVAQARGALAAAGADGALPVTARADLRAASKRLAAPPALADAERLDPTVAAAWRDFLVTCEVDRRPEVADRLVAAHDAWPVSSRPLRAAARQLERASRLVARDEAIALLRRAVEVAEEAVSTYGGGGDVALASSLHARLAHVAGDPSALAAAIAHARRLTELDPHGITVWVRLGDLLWGDGQREEARTVYRRALEKDDNFELDPLKQLPARERRAIEERLDED